MEQNPVEATSRVEWPLPVAVLGGGLGTRLRPFTMSMPKPLVEVNGKPMIDRVIDGFRTLGCHDFLVTTGYRASQLRRHFEASRQELRVRFVDNGELDGNAIWWRTLKGSMKTPFVLTCCDVLVDADYESVAHAHANDGNAMTLVCYRHRRVIPAGALLVTEGGSFEGFAPHKEMDELLYSGVSIVGSDAFALLGDEGPLNLNELVLCCHRAGLRVGVHEIDEDTWYDMGDFGALARMSRTLKKVEGDRTGTHTP